jgi:monoamine oxidase
MQEAIIIIGAGATGLMAARKLSAAGHAVTVLESNDRIGGRIHTIQPPGFLKPIEEGAEFMHGKLPLTMELLKEAGIPYQPVSGNMVRVQHGEWSTQDDFIAGWDELMDRMADLKNDLTLADFLQRYFNDEKYALLRQSAQRFAEGFDVAEPTEVSVFGLRDEWSHEEEEQYRILGGYTQVMEYLKQASIADGCSIHTSSTVKTIRWQPNQVEVVTANGQVFTTQKAIITLPLGVLQAAPQHSMAISFEPAISAQTQAVQQIGFGSVVKVIIQFSERFWLRYKKDPGFILSEEAIPTWWTHSPDTDAILTGWLGGPKSARYTTADNNTVLQDALQSLANIFSMPVNEIRSLVTASHIATWQNNPGSLGAYSYNKLFTTDARALLNKPVQDTLYFAGEGLYDGINGGTVEAALQSAVDVVKLLG